MRTDISLVFDTTLVTKPRSITAHFPTLSVSATGTQHFIFHLFCADSRLCSSLTWENKMQNWEGFFCFSESENLIFVALVIVWRILRQQPVSLSQPPSSPPPPTETERAHLLFRSIQKYLEKSPCCAKRIKVYDSHLP